MGEVWLARHQSLKHDVAVKFLSLAEAGGQTFARHSLERFRFEGQVAARLSGHSPYIAAVHDVGSSDDGQAYLVMEYVRGPTLESILDGRGKLSPSEVQRLVEHVTLALEVAHARDIVHRDLKPSNLMVMGELSGDGRVKVTDFGVAKMLARDHDLDAPQPTREGVLVGSPSYMSPEQLTGDAEPGPAADRWALAVVAYEALTGWPPFSGSTLSELTVAVCRSAHEPPSAHDDSLPGAIDAWFERALAKHPADRFDDVAQMRRAFSDALADSGERPARRLPWKGVAAAALVAVCASVVVAAWPRAASAPTPARDEPDQEPQRRAPAAPQTDDQTSPLASESAVLQPEPLRSASASTPAAPRTPPPAPPAASGVKPAAPEFDPSEIQ